ncbi:MAG: radical SAM protein [Bacillota bacterium]|nr:radical SAM protein [Bacillota bacterium]MDW7678672.1 radical SAM protein [Bacillota bacterium]
MNQPGCLQLSQKELTRRSEILLEGLKNCTLCPRHCHVDRTADQKGDCRTARRAVVASAQLHFGEEPEISGTQGSGTIFFSRCNLHCQFCQNHDISQSGYGSPVSARELATMMLDLQHRGAHNINLVTPSHVVPQILEALCLAVPMGLNLPLVYNSGGYDEVATLQLLDGIIDIYMPDFKTLSSDFASTYLGAADYPDVAARALAEMHRQTGLLQTDSTGIAHKGLLIRHLVMPGRLEDTRQILAWIAAHLSSQTHVNLMGQYHPAFKAREHPALDTALSRRDYQQALALKREMLGH